MELSNTSDFSSSTWIPYVTSMPWTLASNTGEQTVFVQYRSISGGIVGSAQASIDLAAAPVQTISSATSTAGMSVSQMQNLLASLEAQLQALQSEASGTTTVSFARNLSYGMTGNSVKALQSFLIKKNAGPAARRLAAHGATTNFGPLTKAALIEFQKSVGIKLASGYFGPITRAYVNAHE
jgi:murein L,D-transpeptidase YcbB/YkuD